MNEISVWAPHAEHVACILENTRHSMKKKESGWWYLSNHPIEAGTDYAFVVDESKPLPDPRSNWQPEGVHGVSRVVDHNAFTWHDYHFRQCPLSAAIMYELHIGTFTDAGTFEACIDKLDHLKELGVTHVELMPVAQASGSRGWGYDGVALYAPHHAYGGPEGLKKFVAACHKKGLAVILDVVYNHLGPEGNYLAMFGPYFTDHYKTPWGQAVNLDGEYSTEVRRFFIDNALMWMRDYHIDGLRLDAVHAIYDMSAYHFLEELADKVKALEASMGKHLILIAESNLNDPRHTNPVQNGGYGLDAQWNDDFHHALHTYLTGECAGYYMDFGKPKQIVQSYTDVFVYNGTYSKYRKRIHGKPISNIEGKNFLVFTQNHDQVGNRARGDRLCHLITADKIMIAAALMLTSPFIPLIFQGEEWSATSPFQYFTDHQDAGLGEAVSNGRKNEFKTFGWDPKDIPDPQDEATFLASKLNWDELNQDDHRKIYEWYKRLIELRSIIPALACGRPDKQRVEFHKESRWFTVLRDTVIIAYNFSDDDVEIALPGTIHSFTEIVITSKLNELIPQHNSVWMQPRSVCIIRSKE